jgi:predicted methyltransferase
MMRIRQTYLASILLEAALLFFPLIAADGIAAEPELDAVTDAALDSAMRGEHRSAENKSRDKFRHPKETLAFFGFRSDMTVVEIWPGGGWYTEILAPALREDGKLYAAQYSVNPPFGYQRRYFGAFLTKAGESPDLYRDMTITAFDFPYALNIAPSGTADLVVTFRNAHNWVSPGYPKVAAALAFQAMFDALKPGGVLGIVDHRWPEADSEDPAAENGYISEERLIALAEAAGFEFAGRSDLNRNPKDTHDHRRGVWTLPPTFALGEEDREKYAAIGESDRLTIKFNKPSS